MGGYIPQTSNERLNMLNALGIDSANRLFADVPQDILCKGLEIPEEKSELELRREIEAMANRNSVFSSIFRGAGAYNHYIPSIVKQISSKESFVTSYTPYQAEISQGILQIIFEYQSDICAITGMDISNASVYDGASAAAEAVAMCREKKRVRALVAENANPDTIAVIKTYSESAGFAVDLVPSKDGGIDLAALESMLGDDVACVYLQSPNFFGTIENAKSVAQLTHNAGAKFIYGCNPIAAALLETPAEAGADIAVGDGQPLGIPLSFGGPYLGFMACNKAMMRKLPGRIAGQTTDAEGNRCFVLTLQAREQHIRREKSISSICSNQALCALTASAYIAVMGPAGLKNAAEQCYAKAHYAAEKLEKAGYKRIYSKDFFHEFVTECPVDTDKLMAELEQQGILGGLPVEQGILWCFTEQNTRQDIDRLVSICEKEARA